MDKAYVGPSSSARIMRAKYFCLRVFPLSLQEETPSCACFLPMIETFQSRVCNNHSVKTLGFRRHFPCFLSLLWYFIENLNIDFVVFQVGW